LVQNKANLCKNGLIFPIWINSHGYFWNLTLQEKEMSRDSKHTCHMTIPYSSPNSWGPCVMPNLISRRVQILPPHSNYFDLNQRSRCRNETHDVLNLFVKYLSKFSYCYVPAYSSSHTVLMSILDHLWDDTVAGPRPENGLGKLRKHPTFPTRSISDKGTHQNLHHSS